MSKKWFVSLLVFTFISTSSLLAQSADDVLRNSIEYPSYDPVSLVVPAVSQPTGFGAYQDNPASMALFEESFFSVGLSSRFIDETGTYLGNSSNFSDNQTGIGDIGLLYKVPTERGSLVVGGGYSQTTDFNRALSAGGRNEETTITDFYNTTADDSLFFAAFDTYAVDFATTDSSYSDTKSIFRFFDDDFYPGINQDVEMTERGKMGEYSIFLATEFLKDLSVGASIGYLSGSYSYRREFLESDRQNDYDAAFIDTDGDGDFETDIDNILSVDRIDSDIQAFSARVGVVYNPQENISVAASYEFPSRLYIDETFNTEITTTFDNSVQFSDEAPGQFSYEIVRPQRLKVGATLQALGGVKISASAEGVQYSEAKIDFDELDLNPLKNSINSTVQSNFNDVINLRGGLEFDVNESFTPRVGYAYFPNPQDGFGSARQFINGGFSAVLTKGLKFDFGLQYSFWDDQNSLYEYTTPTGESGREIVQEEVTRLNVMAGLRMTL